MIRILLFLFLIMGITLEIKAQWSTSNLSQAKDYFSATSSGNKVFFAGGELGSSRSNVVDIYDISTNSWTTATLSQARRSVASVALGTKVFFAGGYLGATSTNVVDIYDTSTNTWSTATLSEARNSLAATTVGTKVFFAGGTNSSNLRSNVVDIYDNSTNTWSTASLSVARDDLSATSVGTKVFFAGGNTGGGASDVVDIYDNSTNTWSTATLSAGRFDLRATSAGTKAFFAGGNGGAFRSTRVDVYDNSTGLWTLIMLSQGRDRLSASTLGNQVFFAGGASSSSAKSNVVDIYDIISGTWSTAALSVARDNLASASAGNKVFFGGGYDGTARSNVVDIYSGSVLEPTAQPTNLIFSPVGFQEITLNYTAAIGNPDGYIILRKQGSASTAIPGDGITYAQSDVIGDAEVVYSGNNLTFNDTGLSDETVYYYRIFSYNGSGASINYLTPSPLSGNQTTGILGQYFSRQNGNWNAPATWSVIGPSGPPATGVPVGSSGERVNINAGTTVTATGTMELGGGVIDIKPGGTLNAAGNDFNIFGSLIIDGTLLNAGSVVGSGSISSAGPAFPVFDQIIYGGTFPGSGISLDNTDVVALNGASPADGTSVLDLNGFILYPCLPPSNSTLSSAPLFTNLNGTSMTLSWTNPASGTDGVMVVARAGGSLVKPVPGSAYTANSIFGQGSETETGSLNYIVYQGTGNTVTITGLAPNTVYTFGIYQLNGSSCYNIRTMLEPSQNSGNNPAPILTFNPVNGATNVSVSGNITITTSEAIRKIDNSPITASDLTTLVELKLINNGGATVPFSATIDGTRTVITIDPTSNLSSNTIYYVELNPVEDIDNIATSAQSITFTTGDATPPLVTFVPVNAATNISNGTNITLTFSEAIRNLDNTAVTNANVSVLITLKLTNASGANIPFTATIDGTKTIITIDPTNALADLSDVYVAVSNVEDNSDNALSPSPQSITFTTGDATPPTVIFTPANTATGIGTSSNITLAFSEPIRNLDNSTVTDANVSSLLALKLTNASGANIPFVATINVAKTVITIDPSNSLSELSVIYVAVSGVEDNSNNALSPSPQSITFTTGDATLPLVTFNPVNAATNVNTNSNVILTFSEPIRNIDNSPVTDANVASLLTLKLNNASGANIAFTATINGAKTVITINPTSVLADMSVIYVAVNNIEDNSDNVLLPSPQSITFTTGDMTPPTVTFSPLNGATNVSVGANILVTFDEPVQQVGGTPITSANATDLFIFKLTNASGASVPFTTTINGSSTIITIDPVSSLLPNQIYFLRYDVVQDAAGNITTTGNINFTTQAGPSITNVSPVSVCLGQPITITGTNFGATLPTVSINSVNIPVTAHSSTSITILPSSPVSGVITVTNTDVSLSAVSSSSITTSASPNVFAVTGGGSYCAGGNGVTIGLSNSQSGVEYEVYLGVTATGRKLTSGGGAFNFTGLFTTAGTYSVKGKNAGNCSSDMSGTAVVQVNNIPSGTGSITSSTTVICQDGSVDLTAVGFVNGLTFEWTLPAGLSTTSSISGSTINVSGGATPGGTVSVVARNNCGLSNPATLAIMVNAKPVVSIEISPADQQIVNEALQFTAVVDIPVSSYTWSFGDGGSSSDENPEHTYTDVGDFRVSLMVKTDAGCEGLAEETFSIKEFPSLSTTAIKNVVTANNDGKNDRLIVVNIDRFPNNTLSVLDRWGVEVYKQEAYNNDWDFKKGGNYLPAGNYICIVKLNDSGTIITRTVTLVKK